MHNSRRQFLASVTGMTWSSLLATHAFAGEESAWNFFTNLGADIGVVALPSDDLADAIGINTHLNWRDKIWGQTQAWRQPLIDLGARYHRTSLGALPDARADFLWLWENGGLRGLMLCSRIVQVDGIGPVFNTSETEAYLNFLRNQIGVDKLIGVEGPNEPNHPAIATEGWALRVCDHQQWLYGAGKHIFDERLPVVGPSVHRRVQEDYAALGDLSAWLDVANLHNYTGGYQPSIGLSGDPAKPTTLNAVMDQARSVAPGTPLWVTEYNHDANEDTALQSSWVTSPEVAAKYLLRGLVLKFKRGARRIFVYSLLDDAGAGEYYGLLANTAPNDISPRPTYHALKRFLARLSDRGPAHAPGTLNYTLDGDLKDIETLLLQKRDGTWVLLIWQEVSLWDRANKSEIRPARRSLTLSLPFPASVKGYEPSESEDEITLAHNTSSVSLAVPGHMLMIEMKRVSG